MGRLSTYALSRLVGNPGATTTVPQLFGWPMWFTMFFDDPLPAVDPLSLEIGAGSFARVPASAWSAYGASGAVNLQEIMFHAIPVGAHAAAVGVMDAQYNGHLIGSDLLHDPTTGALTPIDFPAGGTWTLPAGEFYLGFDLTGLSP